MSMWGAALRRSDSLSDAKEGVELLVGHLLAPLLERIIGSADNAVGCTLSCRGMGEVQQGLSSD